jgi:predicted enzyme related to lactoylglutathione lyase
MVADGGRVTGIGGLFFRADDPAMLKAWYARMFAITGGGDGMPWVQNAGMTVFEPFAADTSYFRADRRFMLNLRVDGIDALIARLEAGGTTVRRLPDESYGRFAHLEDPEGNPIELWEPAAG